MPRRTSTPHPINSSVDARIPTGLTATRAVYVGKTSSGLNIFGAYVYDAAANNNEVYSVISDSSFAYQSSTELTTGVADRGVYRRL